jgi:hypothetical protein
MSYAIFYIAIGGHGEAFRLTVCPTEIRHQSD